MNERDIGIECICARVKMRENIMMVGGYQRVAFVARFPLLYVVRSTKILTFFFFVVVAILFGLSLYLFNNTIGRNEEMRWRVSKVKDSMTYHLKKQFIKFQTYIHIHKIEEIEINEKKKYMTTSSRDKHIYIETRGNNDNRL